MSLASKIQVDLPRSGIIIRKSYKNKYVYKVIKTYRNEKGQPTNTRVSIGKLDSDSGRLIPNDNYFAHYGDDVLVANTSDNEVSGFDCVKSVGGTFLVEKISENLEVSNILTDIFGVEKANLIQIVVKHMVLNGNVFEFIENWCDEFVLDAPNLTSPSVSALFSSIS